MAWAKKLLQKFAAYYRLRSSRIVTIQLPRKFREIYLLVSDRRQPQSI